MPDTVYRFLPWSRRGLAAALPAPADGAPLPARARVGVQVVVGGGTGPVPTTTTLNGPGDVVGLDPSMIIRTIPRPGATNVEPNYLAAVDFDPPELPWLFTPAGAPASGHLLPWLVLVVVEEREGVSVTIERGAHLPHLSITSGAATELPDLAESWAWAHVQLLDADAGTSTASVGSALADRPDHAVSRLMCPRRLKPDTSWIACVVPAFDVGVIRGFGGTPADGDIKPAWSAPDSIDLPVYHHWRFQTGPQGDFESLARRLKPREASARIGRIRMHVGVPTPFIDRITGPQRFLDMDGALQAPMQARRAANPPVTDAELADVPDALRDGLERVAGVLADTAQGAPDDDGPALGPPLYGGKHIRRTTVADIDDTWFREVNTDPRSRVAAGLGAEVMRKYQDDVMEACWQQVGDVIETEAALSRARLSLEISRRFVDRHLTPLADGRYLQITAPVADRTLVAGRTLPASVEPTSFPERTTDAAMRRYTAPRGRVLRGVARRNRTDPVAQAVRDASETLVTSLAAGRTDVDATRFPVIAIDGLPQDMPQAGNDGKVDLEKFGAGVRVDAALGTALTNASTDLKANPPPPVNILMKPRPDLRNTGLITSAQLVAARELTQMETGQTAVPTNSVLDSVLSAAASHPDNSGFVVEVGPKLDVRPLGIGSGGRIVVVTDHGQPNVTVGVLDARLRGGAREMGDVIAKLPPNSIRNVAARVEGNVDDIGPIEVARGVGMGQVVVKQPAGGGQQPPAPPTITIPPMVKDAAVISRYESAVSAAVAATAFGSDPPSRHVVVFDIAAAVTATRARVDPATVHPARLDTMVSFGGYRVTSVAVDPALLPAWAISTLLDRVMAFPHLELPAYTYLAGYDRTRFCPGIDELPTESITLLETNPRFIAAFMAGLNQETNSEMLWRGYPTDGRGTPWQRFWDRVDRAPDVFEMHQWGPRGGRDDLPGQTADPAGNLVLLLRGDLLRRYPDTMGVAVRAVSEHTPSSNPDDVRLSVFRGWFDPDVAYFGFPLTSADLDDGAGWFFGLLEPITEPRFGFDETVGRTTLHAQTWNDVAWPDLGVAPSGLLTVAQLNSVGLPPVGQADGVAVAAYQRPFKVLVHANHMVGGI